jgi:hypothetical protein
MINIEDQIGKSVDALEKNLEDRLRFVKEFTKTFAEAIRKVFEIKSIYAITWTQYTPYFNDGDECVFNIGEIYFIDESDKEEFEDDYPHYYEGVNACYTYEYFSQLYPTYSLESYKILEGFDTLIQQSEDCLKAVFGDHVSIKISRDGNIQVDGYYHD